MARWFLRNPGFELGPGNWSIGSLEIVNDPTNARNGSWCLRHSTGGGASPQQTAPFFPIRPGSQVRASLWLKGGSGTGAARLRIFWKDKDGVGLASADGNPVAPGSTDYVQSSGVAVAPASAKFVSIGVRFLDATTGTWYADDFDAEGDIIEEIPSSAIIREGRMTPAETVAAFDPLVGETKFTEFNAGMSDRWAGVMTFVPALGGDLGELVAFMMRIGKRDRFFAFDPNRVVPLNGVVDGLVVDGGANGGNTRIPVRGGTPDTTPLVYGDYVEIGAQYFMVLRPLNIGPEGTGELIVWPSVRASLADGEPVITDHPKCVARMTSEIDWRRLEAKPVGPLSLSWIEAV